MAEVTRDRDARALTYNSRSTPVYAPNSYGGPHADEQRHGNPAAWESSGDQVRLAYVKHAEDGDFVQPGILYREVLTEDAKERLASNIIGHVSNGVREPVLFRVFEYWSNVDPDLGKKVQEGVRAKLAETEPAAGPSPVPTGDEAAKA
jgi:catalase